MIEVNLLPGQKRKTAGGGGKFKLPDFRKLATSIKDPWLIAAVVAWVLVGGAVVTLYLVDHAKTTALETRVAAITQESRRFIQVVEEKRKSERIRDSLVVQLNVIRLIDAQRYVWPHILDQVTKALPPYTWLADMSQVSAPPAPPVQGGQQRPPMSDEDSLAALQAIRVQLRGRTVDIQAYTTFLRQLAASPWITDVTPANSQTVIESDRPVTEFQVSFRFKGADSVYIRTVPLVQSVR
jgi:Tfp pilus assembly protein PilN